jgi:hypothetical protein
LGVLDEEGCAAVQGSLFEGGYRMFHRYWRLKAVVVAGALSLAATLIPASAASAAPQADPSSTKSALLAQGPGYVIVNPVGAGVSHVGTSTFYPTGAVSSDTLIIIPADDGTLPGGLTVKQAQSIIAKQGVAGLRSAVQSGPAAVTPMLTGGQSWLAPVPGQWGPTYTYNVAMWGSPGIHMSYTFAVTEGTNQQAAGMGLGYYVGYNGSTLGTWAKYYGLGVASDGSVGGAVVPWGNVLAHAKFYARSTILLHWAGGDWRAGLA